MSQPAQPQFSLRGAVDLSSLGKPAPAPAEGAADAGKWVVDVTDTNFQPVIEGSADYLVLLLVWLPSDPTCQQIAAHLSQIADEKDGAFQLARVDAEASPNIARALQAQGVPYVVAVLGGQPVPLFQGTAELDQIRDVVDQVLQAAAANGVTGKAPSAEPAVEDEPSAVPEKPLPPLHQEASDALEAGDFAGAVAAYEKALVQDPRDVDAAAGLAQTNLLLRLEGVDAAAIRQAAAESPDDIEAQLAVADLDLAGGKVQDALDRLIQKIGTVFGDDREKLRTRLIDYFALLGAEDPRVAPARRALAAALY